jgi:carbon storage regulator CsrA
MLVLTRRIQESIVVLKSDGIGPLLTVTVLESKSGSVRLGFEAKTDLLIHRWEVWQQILAGGQLASPRLDPAAPVV